MSGPITTNAMQTSISHRPSSRPPSWRWTAASGIAAAIAAVALAACGPRDEAPLAGSPAGSQGPTTSAQSSAAPTTVAAAEASRIGSPVPTATSTAPPAAPAVVQASPSEAMAPQGPAPVQEAAPKAPARVAQAAPVPAPAPAVPRNRIGSVSAIEPIRTRPQGSGAGAVIGGVLGGVLGNQFGHGLGRAAMTGVGAAGGAIAGNNVERNYKEGVSGYRVHIRLDNGSTRTFQRKSVGDLRVGDRVRLDANGFHRG